jgi:hypothetical protein
MIEWLPILIFPICALVAVVVIALVQRGAELDDRGLLLSFAVLFSITLLLVFGLLRTQWVQGKLDPTIELAAQLEAHPVIQALTRFHGDDNLALTTAMLAEMDRGMPISEALQKARPALARIGQERLGFADENARIAWGRAELQALRELKRRSVQACAALALNQSDPKGYLELAAGLSAENQQAFELAFVAVLTSADADMRREGTPPSQNIDLNQLQQRYREIRKPLVQRHGEAVAGYLERRRFEQLPTFSDTRALCEYRIDQLDAILREPPAMSARMLDAAMR